MALEEYKRKRDFGKTSEPPPGTIKVRKEELSDLIRMHGDEKKENWLLIKAKDAEARANGQASGFLDENAYSITTGRSMDDIASGEKAKPRKAPKTGKSLAAAQEGLSALEKKYPGVQLATLVDAPPVGEKWLHEIKFDGYRLLGFLSGGEVVLRTRNGLDWTSKFPSVASAIAGLKAKDAVLDMEAVVLDENGKSGFQALQAALGDGGRRDRIVAYTFDVLHF